MPKFESVASLGSQNAEKMLAWHAVLHPHSNVDSTCLFTECRHCHDVL